MNQFDVVVIHYTILIISDTHLSPAFCRKLAAYQGLKVQFIQDDYRWVNDICAKMRHIGIDVLYTLVPKAEIDKVWSEDRLPGVQKIETLAGYIPERLAQRATPRVHDRPLDVVYRGREVPFWLGTLGQDKIEIGRGFLRRARGTDLKCDIGWRELDRIYGEDWIRFICSAKATLGTESGSSITDFDGSLDRRVSDYLAEHRDADFQTVFKEILEPYEGNVMMNVISPRIFEAIALRTPMILFPGWYRGVIEPWRHYIPLEKDFSNFEQVVELLRDHDYLQAMADRTFEEIVGCGRYTLRQFISDFDECVAQRATGRRPPTWVRNQVMSLEFGVRRRLRLVSRVGDHGQRIRVSAALRCLLLKPSIAKAFLKAALMSRDRSRSVASVVSMLKAVAFVQLIGEIRRGRRVTPQVFDLLHSIDSADRRLRLESVPRHMEIEKVGAPGAAHLDRAGIEAWLQRAFARPDDYKIEWSHKRLGSHLALKSADGVSLVPIGNGGSVELKGLLRLGASEPGAMSRHVAAMLTAEVRPPRTRGHMLHAMPHFVRSLRSCAVAVPRRIASSLVRVFLIGRVLLSRPDRRLLMRYLGDSEIRRTIPLARMLKELLILQTLREVCRNPAAAERRMHGYHIEVSLDSAARRLVLTSHPLNCHEHVAGGINGAAATSLFRGALQDGRLDEIRWDHSRCNNLVCCPLWGSRGHALHLGQDGIFEFVTISALGKRYPSDLEAMLTRTL